MLATELGISHALLILLEVIGLDAKPVSHLWIGGVDGANCAHQLLDFPLVKQAFLVNPHPRFLVHLAGLTQLDTLSLNGTEITDEKLARIDRFEEGLHDLGFRQLRVRYHDTIARLEIDAAELGRVMEERVAIVALGKAAGFTYVALDLEGFRSGAMNETLTQLRRTR